MSGSILISQLNPYKNKYELLTKDQDVSDIISAIVAAHKVDAKEYDKICDYFWDGGPVSTARKIFRFCKAKLPYKVESEESQTVKTPAAILQHGSTIGNDCKNYALFIGGILDALRRKGKMDIDAHYRFASYEPHRKKPHHVFVVMNYKGNEYWVDPVLATFDNRKQYFYKVDKNFPMPLYRVSGVEDSQNIGAWRDAVLKNPQYTLRHYQMFLRRNRAHHSPNMYRWFRHHYHHINQPGFTFSNRSKWQDRPGAVRLSGMDHVTYIGYDEVISGDEVGKWRLKIRLPKIKIRLPKIDVAGYLKKFGLAAPRNAFLGLLKLNVHQMAVRIYRQATKNPAFKDKLFKTWDKFGGNTNVLWRSVTQGVKNYNKHHSKKVKISGIGAENPYFTAREMEAEHKAVSGDEVGFAIAAALAAAAPIIIKVIGLLKGSGEDTKGIEKDTSEAVAAGAANDATGTETADQVADKVEKSNKEIDKLSANSATDEVEAGSNADGSTALRIKGGRHNMQDNAPMPSDGGGADDSGGGQVPAAPGTGGGTNFIDTAKNWLINPGAPVYKKPIAYIGAGATILVISKFMGKKRRR